MHGKNTPRATPQRLVLSHFLVSTYFMQAGNFPRSAAFPLDRGRHCSTASCGQIGSLSLFQIGVPSGTDPGIQCTRSSRCSTFILHDTSPFQCSQVLTLVLYCVINNHVCYWTDTNCPNQVAKPTNHFEDGIIDFLTALLAPMRLLSLRIFITVWQQAPSQMYKKLK